MTRLLAATLAALSLAAPLAACSGSVRESARAPAPPASAVAERPAPAAPVAASMTLHRSAVRAAVDGGLGLFLQKVTVDDEPVRKGGRFHGFRIAALRDPAFWKGIDLRPGDVVVRVNGMAIEHPEEALEVFHSLESAAELRVFYERDGEPRELKFAIVEDDGQPQKHADASAP